MPIEDNKGGICKEVKTNSPNNALSKEEVEFVYKRVNAKMGINTKMIKKEMAQVKLSEEQELNNTYQKAISAEVSKEKEPTHIEEWSILSDHVKYITHDDSEAFHKLNDTLYYRQNKDLYKEFKEKAFLDASVNFCERSIKLKANYLDVYEGVYAEVFSTNRFDEDTDISTTYLGQVNMTRDIEVKAEESFLITVRGFTRGQLLGGTDCEILNYTGASKSYMSKSYFLRCESLHAMPKFTSTTRRIQVGNEQYVGVLFVIPVIITIQKHRFEIFTLVSEIHENVDLVLGIKNLFELEGVIDSWDYCVSFLNRSLPFFPSVKVEVKPREQKLIVLEAPFVEEISGMAITKMLDIKEQLTLTMKLKFIRNRAILKVTNSTHDTVTFNPMDMLCIVDLRSLGYYKIKQRVLQQNLSSIYHFETVNTV